MKNSLTYKSTKTRLVKGQSYVIDKTYYTGSSLDVTYDVTYLGMRDSGVKVFLTTGLELITMTSDYEEVEDFDNDCRFAYMLGSKTDAVLNIESKISGSSLITSFEYRGKKTKITTDLETIIESLV